MRSVGHRTPRTTHFLTPTPVHATRRYLPVQRSTGLVDLEELESVITPKTTLVSIMTVNNEIGVHQPVKEIGALCRSKGTFFHTDAAQVDAPRVLVALCLHGCTHSLVVLA